jgi:hypothetical protein
MPAESMATQGAAKSSVPPRGPWYTILYIQVLIAIAVGIAVGYVDPRPDVQLKPLGDGFIALSLAGLALYAVIAELERRAIYWQPPAEIGIGRA